MRVRLSQMKRLGLVFLFVWILSLVACTPTSVSEQPIPAYFTTYTDKAGLFSISYPPNWELGLSEMKGITQSLNDYWKGIKPERTPVEESAVVFFAGVPYNTGYNPNVSVLFIHAGEGKWKLEDFVEVLVQKGLMKDTEEYQIFSRNKAIVDGKEAIILEFEAKYPTMGKFHALDMYMRDGRMLIKVGCGVMPPKDFTDFKTDLYTIVRSLRILKGTSSAEAPGDSWGVTMLDVAIKGAITVLPLAIIAGLSVFILKLIERRKKKNLG
jgi:hypothetical protein